jgi:hypothetical protein
MKYQRQTRREHEPPVRTINKKGDTLEIDESEGGIRPLQYLTFEANASEHVTSDFGVCHGLIWVREISERRPI